MTTQQIEEITTRRLAWWVPVTVDAHATPFCLVTVGHDHEAGTVRLIVPHGVRESDIRRILQGALDILARGEAVTVTEDVPR